MNMKKNTVAQIQIIILELKRWRKKMVKKKTETDPLSFDDVPGLGEIGIKSLHKEGYYTTLQLICKTPTFLKDVTGMDKDKASVAFEYMKKKLENAGLIGQQISSATELLKVRKKIVRLSTGCRGLDSLLNGGLEVGAITEVFGEEGSGKTQTTHTLALMAQKKISEGGLWEEGKPKPLVVYIDTENTCRPERFVSILAGKGIIAKIPEKISKKLLEGKVLTKEETTEHEKALVQQEKESKPYLDRIEVQKASNATQQIMYIQNNMRIIKEANIKLIILDSGTALFRSEYLGRGNIKTKFDLMNEMVHDLKYMAEHFGIVVVFVNQIYNTPDQDWGQDPDKPYGGHIIGQTIPYRIKFAKAGKKHKATIIKSPYQDNDEVKFNITAAGPTDVE